MTAWHTIFAISGQSSDFSDPKQRVLEFDPKIKCDGKHVRGYDLPVFLPNVAGLISCRHSHNNSEDDENLYEFRLTVGKITDLARLAVDGIPYPSPIGTIAAGMSLNWSHRSLY